MQRVPFTHGVGAPDLAAQKLPAGQEAGAADPATQKLPAGHTPHVASPTRVVFVHVRAPDTVNPALHVGWHEPAGAIEPVQVPTAPFIGAITLVPLHEPLRRHVWGGPSSASSHSYAPWKTMAPLNMSVVSALARTCHDETLWLNDAAF